MVVDPGSMNRRGGASKDETLESKWGQERERKGATNRHLPSEKEGKRKKNLGLPIDKGFKYEMTGNS